MTKKRLFIESSLNDEKEDYVQKLKFKNVIEAVYLIVLTGA
jgi:hypothetical protein